MTDLVQRLRNEAKVAPDDCWSWLNPLLNEAANEIERLNDVLDGITSLAELTRDEPISLTEFKEILARVPKRL